MKLPVQSIAARLRTLRESRYGSRGQSAFARAIGISPSRYHNYESALNEPPLDLLRKISSVAGCSIAWLVSGEGEPFPPAGSELAPRISVAESGTKYDRARRSIPVLARASAAQPDRIAYTESGHLGDIAIPKHLHGVQVKGDSMAPLALDGQYVLCADEPAGDGDLAVVELRGDEEPQFKRVQFEDDTIYLISVNAQPGGGRVQAVPRGDVRRMRKVWGVRF